MNYKTLHTDIKELITATGFKYIEASQWINIERGVQTINALLNNSFTIRFEAQEPSEYEDYNFSRLRIGIEFCLEAKNDAYLTKLDDAVSAINGLSEITDTGVKILNPERFEDFNSTYLADKVYVTFANIILEIDTKT